MKGKLSIVDIAQEAKVSTATVSRVLNKPQTVSEKTRNNVLAVITRYGYQPNSNTLVSSTVGSKIIFITPSLSNPFYAKMCRFMQHEAARSNYSLEIIQVDREQFLSKNKVEKIIKSRPKGLILSGFATYCVDINTTKAYIDLFQQSIPTIVINSISTKLNCICLQSDIYGSIKTAVKHLYNLGHKRIALLGSADDKSDSGSRNRGYLQQMKELGLEEYIYPFTVGKVPLQGEACTQQLLQQFKGENRPTAFVTYNDLVALGAIKEIKRANLKVPQDIAIVGCDNQFFAPYTDPPLTSTELHIDETVKYAVNLIVEANGKPIAPFVMNTQSTLIVRESCGAMQ